MDYHSDTSSVSRSMLSVLKESPRLFYELYVAKTRQPSPPTPAMVRGTRFDVLLLSPKEYYRQHAVVPALAPDGDSWDRRRVQHKEHWKIWLADNIGREPVEHAEHAELIQMVAGALRHSEIERIVTAEGLMQQRLDWTDPEYGLNCRCLVDKLFVASDLIVDIKTAEDPSPEAFQRSVVRYGYHRQHAWYSGGFRQCYGRTPRFLFAVVGSKPPHDAAVYELDEAAVDSGRSENEFLMRRLAELKASGDWCPTWGQGVVTLGLPRWHDPFKSEVCE